MSIDEESGEKFEISWWQILAIGEATIITLLVIYLVLS